MNTPRKMKKGNKRANASPSPGIRPNHLPAYDGDSITPKKWNRILKKINTPNKSKSNSKRKRVQKLIYRDKGVRRSISNPKSTNQYEEKENIESQKKIVEVVESPPPYLKKHKRGMHGLEGLYDDYKDRMKYIGNSYMYESFEKSKRSTDGMIGLQDLR